MGETKQIMNYYVKLGALGLIRNPWDAVDIPQGLFFMASLEKLDMNYVMFNDFSQYLRLG